MLRFHRQGPLGQSFYGQPQTIDPLVQVGLDAAGSVLAPSDPGAPETMRLIGRIVAAPGLPSFGGDGGVPQTHKLSDLNPTLRVIAFVRENPIFTGAMILAVPVLSFLLGRQAGMRARR